MVKAQGTWSDEITRALLEAAIEGEKQQLKSASTTQEEEKLRKRVQSLEMLHEQLYSEPKPEPMSPERLQELLEQAIRLYDDES